MTPPERSKASSRVTEADARANVLYSALAQRYGPEKAQRQYGRHPSDAFVNMVAGLTDEQIDAGLVVDWREAREWPPTISQFERWCIRGTPAAHQPFTPALPEPESEKERRRQVGLDHLANIRELLNMGPYRGPKS